MAGCGKAPKKKGTVMVDYYGQNEAGIVSIETYDHFNQKKGESYGFYVAPDIIVTNLDWIQGAFKAKAAPMDGKFFENITGYVGYNKALNIVLLHVGKRNKQFLDVGEPQSPDLIYSLFNSNNTLYLAKSAVVDSAGVKLINGSFDAGKPAFGNNHKVAAIIQKSGEGYGIVPADSIAALLKRCSGSVTSLYDLRLLIDKEYPSYKLISGFNIITDMGNIRIKLSDEVPDYRDNFIRLVCDNFYDSLLVHRVLKDFLIQTGASDSKYAGRDDVVGWQGPGYTLPMHVNTSLFHRRGAIAASKLPPDRNPKNRSDGSQFYIVSGRVFTSSELDDLEKQKGIRYTPAQRQVYTTVGGAPYLDGDYTVFGEVVSGMEVVDRIAAVEVYNVDRPLVDIRIKRIEPIMR